MKELVQLTAGRDSSKATPKHHPTAGIVPPTSQRVSKGLVSGTTCTSSDSPSRDFANYAKSQPKDNLNSEYSSYSFKNSHQSSQPTNNVPSKRHYQTINYHHKNPSFTTEKGWYSTYIVTFKKHRSSSKQNSTLSSVHASSSRANLDQSALGYVPNPAMHFSEGHWDAVPKGLVRWHYLFRETPHMSFTNSINGLNIFAQFIFNFLNSGFFFQTILRHCFRSSVGYLRQVDAGEQPLQSDSKALSYDWPKWVSQYQKLFYK